MKSARRAAFGGALALWGASAAAAAVLRVPEEYATIRAGILAATAGDTVLVGPGRYREPIRMKDGVVLRAAAGPDSTVLLSPGLGERLTEERLLEVLEGCGRSTVIEGFTMDADSIAGCAVYCENSSPTIRGNRIVGFGWGIHLQFSDARIEDNVIERCNPFGILVRGSSPEVFRNTIRECQPEAVVISGKNSHPTIGGSPENRNRIYGYGSGFAIVNQSRNDIDATWNDWGWETAAEMDRKGYPEDIVAIQDGNDHGKTHRGKGKVDYRHWVSARDSERAASPAAWIAVLAAVALAVLFGLLAMRRRAAARWGSRRAVR